MSNGKKNVLAIESGAGFIGSRLANKLIKKARQKGISDEKIYDLVREGEATDEMIDRIINVLFRNSSEYLNLISNGETLIIDACDGTEILVDAKDVFNYIDSDFRNWKADEPGQATGEMPIDVYEMAKDGTYSQLFNSLNPDVEKLFFTQAQIKGFVKKHRKWLRKDGYGTFFPFKSNSKRFVANVLFNSVGGLIVDVYEFERGYVWYAEFRRRLVVPQLAVVTQ